MADAGSDWKKILHQAIVDRRKNPNFLYKIDNQSGLNAEQLFNYVKANYFKNDKQISLLPRFHQTLFNLDAKTFYHAMEERLHTDTAIQSYFEEPATTESDLPTAKPSETTLPQEGKKPEVHTVEKKSLFSGGIKKPTNPNEKTETEEPAQTDNPSPTPPSPTISSSRPLISISSFRQTITSRFKGIKIPYLITNVAKNLGSRAIRVAIRGLGKPVIASSAIGALAGLGWGVLNNAPNLLLPMLGGAGAGQLINILAREGVGKTLGSLTGSLNSLSRGGVPLLSSSGDTSGESGGGLADQARALGSKGGGLIGSGTKLFNRYRTMGIVIIILLIVLLIVLIFFFFSGFGKEDKNKTANADNIEVKKEAPTQVEKRGDITYRIIATYKGSGTANVVITDKVPSGTTFQDTASKDQGNIPCQSQVSGSESGGVVTWQLQNILPQTPQILCLTVTAPDEDTYVYNQTDSEVTSEAGNSKNGVSINLSGPANIPDIDTDLVYTATVNYAAPGSVTLNLSNPLPPNTKVISSSTTPSDNPVCDRTYDESESQTTPTWSDLTLESGQAKKVCITLRATADNNRIDNVVKANITNQTSGNTTSNNDNLIANENNCNGKYRATINKNPLRKNFGDPECNINKDDLYNLLKIQDPDRADFWFHKVIPCESSYNPNEYNGQAVDEAGAWGLYQMGRGKNGEYDHGDVFWRTQTTNAVNYFRTVLNPKGISLGGYWACAR